MSRKTDRWLARIVGVFFMLAGSSATFGAVLMMNKFAEPPEEEEKVAMMEFKVKKPKPKKKKQEVQQVKKQRKRSTRPQRNIAPPPDLGVSVSGVDFGIPEYNLGELTQVSDSLVGDMENLVMTEDSVDKKPTPTYRTPVAYPPRAKSKNIEGRVIVNILIGKDGSVKKAKIVEAEPIGVFEESVMNSIQSWRFNAATYKGQPVEVWVSLPMEFSLQ